MKIRHTARSISLLLAALMLTGSLAACSKPAGSTSSTGSAQSSGSTMETDVSQVDTDTNPSSGTDVSGSVTEPGVSGGSGSTTKANGKTTSKVSGTTTTSPNNQTDDDGSYSINVDGLQKNTIYLFSNSALKADGYMEQDTTRLIVCLQGLINRTFDKNKIVLYLNMDASDPVWLDYISGDGKMLDGMKTIRIDSFDQFLKTFEKPLKSTGMIAWDTGVPATANVASTICGLDGYLPVKYDKAEGSLYNKLKSMGVPLRMNLVGKFTGKGTIPDTNIKSSGSAKCDAYLWAMEKYMDRCSTRYIAYTPDGAGSVPGHVTASMSEAQTAKGNAIPNHDYFIARQCFFFDLTCYEKEAPCDDPNQPIGTDAATMKKIFQKRYDLAKGEMGKVLGFPPWWLKYTAFGEQGTLAETDLEWRFSRFATQYNLVKEADAAMPCSLANASIYYQYPLKDSYENNRPTTTMKFDPNKKYITFYLGDYDSSAWLKEDAADIWKDKQLGKVPIMLPFNPNLSERVPMIFDYVYTNKKTGIYFTAGDCGAGYIIPSALFQGKSLIDFPGVSPEPRSLPSGDKKWIAYNQGFYSRFDLDITGFIINSYNPMDNDVLEMYNQISPVGSFFNSDDRSIIVYKGVPYVRMGGIPNHADGTSKINATMYQHIATTMKGTNFAAFRSVKDSPSDVRRAFESFKTYASSRDDYEYVAVDPYTFFDLVKQSGQGTIIQ